MLTAFIIRDKNQEVKHKNLDLEELKTVLDNDELIIYNRVKILVMSV